MADDQVLKGILTCGECTITLKGIGIALKLGLPMDEPVIMGAVVIPGKEDLYEAFLGKVSNKFQGNRIEMKWLQDNFKELPMDIREKHPLPFVHTCIFFLNCIFIVTFNQRVRCTFIGLERRE
ncbi:hypothetical protein J1N35_026304 [Gossypium stocksii]|uniref:Uncharacterized protein n=1 Tax=Gossypium stocksii TaxID=47602 RepID=A0A9D3V926_9ROSI|nr:hypothetical protein J1N35_026304 [Gossypium stocksii]